jgi:hypothetical protein
MPKGTVRAVEYRNTAKLVIGWIQVRHRSDTDWTPNRDVRVATRLDRQWMCMSSGDDLRVVAGRCGKIPPA